MADEPQFAHHPDKYAAKDYFSTWADAALMIGYGTIWDVLYLLPEYQRLRDTQIVSQWMRVPGEQNQYYVSVQVPEGPFKNVVQRGMRESKNLKVCFEKKACVWQRQEEKTR